MLARSASIRLKPKGHAEFARVIEREAIPLLRKQRGFPDEITFFVPGGSEAVEISLWDRKEDADAYGRKASRGVVKALGNVIEGDSEVRIDAVSNPTFHKIAAPVFARGYAPASGDSGAKSWKSCCLRKKRLPHGKTRVEHRGTWAAAWRRKRRPN